MAHEVQKMAYVGEVPWHGLGNNLTEGEPLEVWTVEAGFNFEVKEAPVHFFPVIRPALIMGIKPAAIPPIRAPLFAAALMNSITWASVTMTSAEWPPRITNAS